MIDVIKYPEMTKKISTPTNPPPNPKIKVKENDGQDRERAQAVEVRTIGNKGSGGGWGERARTLPQPAKTFVFFLTGMIVPTEHPPSRTTQRVAGVFRDFSDPANRRHYCFFSAGWCY